MDALAARTNGRKVAKTIAWVSLSHTHIITTPLTLLLPHGYLYLTPYMLFGSISHLTGYLDHNLGPISISHDLITTSLILLLGCLSLFTCLERVTTLSMVVQQHHHHYLHTSSMASVTVPLKNTTLHPLTITLHV